MNKDFTMIPQLRFLGCFLTIMAVLSLGGCATHHLPKDAAVIGGSQASGLWGHAELKGVVLTGKAVTPENVKAAAEALPEVLK